MGILTRRNIRKARGLYPRPPCNRREVGGEGRGAFGFVIGGLVYPLEVFDIHIIAIITAHEIPVSIGCAGYDKA